MLVEHVTSENVWDTCRCWKQREPGQSSSSWEPGVIVWGREGGRDVRACKRPKLHGKSMDGAVACGAAVAKEDAGFRFDFSAAS